MKQVYNIYIDESCHLENDNASVMCLGYTKVLKDDYTNIKEQFKQLKLKHKSPTEIKWSKLSYSRLQLYIDMIDLFFNSTIEFRAVLIKNKSNLNHEMFNRGGHNEFYYKVVYLLLNNTWVNHNDNEYQVYLDIKDTRGRERLVELDKYLQRKYQNNSPFTHLQHIRSHESELLQLTDFFIGAITYKAREEHLKENASKVKCELISYIEQKSGYLLNEGTEPWEKKFNIFDFQISTAK
jgi:hypothetical protein